MWFVFAILAAFFQATYFALNKQLLKKINEYTLGAGVFLSSFIVLFIISLFKGFPELNITFLYAVIATGFLNVIAVILSFKSLKTTDVSLAVPLLSFTPAFMILTSFLILRELPNKFGILGIILIVIGSYILNFESLKLRDILAPFKKLFLTKGLFYMLIVAFIFALSTNYDKLAVVNSDPIFGSAIVCLFIAVLLIIINFFRKTNFFNEYKKSFLKFTSVGFVNALAIFAVNSALILQIAPYVTSVKRVSVLFGVIYGFLLFKEKNIGRRFFGVLFMLAGVALIILRG